MLWIYVIYYWVRSLPLPLLSCELRMFVKENLGGKKMWHIFAVTEEITWNLLEK